MSVLLPAPFSPSRQWISPASMVRSMSSFAVKSPKRFVMPRSSSSTPVDQLLGELGDSAFSSPEMIFALIASTSLLRSAGTLESNSW